MRVLKQEIPKLVTIVKGEMTAAAVAYREQHLACYLPDVKHSRSRNLVIVIAGMLLNGDWRAQQTLQHKCSPLCCENADHTVTKMMTYIPKLVVALRSHAVNKGNWLQWGKPMPFVGILSAMHSLLPYIFSKLDGGPEDWRGM